MTDRVSEEQRHLIMSHINGKDTTIEVKVRKWLFNKGMRYRKNNRKILGTPDISIAKYKIAIFINGCFWHGHDGCKLASVPKTNTEFWTNKINKNKERDTRVETELKKQGWNVFIIWECQLGKNFEKTMNNLYNQLNEIKNKRL
jgi:DNA mismatch endonuclease, patch repair protein